MTDQSKIPLPSEAASADPKGSLIERAVKAFDLSSLAPPPLPDNLAPPVVKPAMRHRPAPAPAATPAAPAPAPIAPAPVEAAPAPAPAVVATPVATPAVVPAPVAIPVAAPVVNATPAIVPAPAPQALQLAEEAVTFPGRKHAVDREHLRELSLILPEGGVTTLLEEFRIVKRQLLLQASDLRRQGGGSAAQRIMVCSPHPGEGKTYCAVNLALSIAAEKESEVVLVDADFAKPSVLDALGLPPGKGLMDALVDPRVDVAGLVMGTDIPGLWVLPAGHATTTDSEYLNASHTRDVLDRLTQGAPRRIVLFDTPPVLAASPAAELARYVGQTVMVVRADRTNHGAIEDAVQLLSGCPNIQLLLNDVHFSPSGRRFGAYYGYGG